MPMTKRPFLPLLILMATLGLGLAFALPAEARPNQHRNNYKTAYNCPSHGPKCGPGYRSGYNRKGGKKISCAYYDRYHRTRGYAYSGHDRYYSRHH